jgi:hypothetical protein
MDKVSTRWYPAYIPWKVGPDDLSLGKKVKPGDQAKKHRFKQSRAIYGTDNIHQPLLCLVAHTIYVPQTPSKVDNSIILQKPLKKLKIEICNQSCFVVISDLLGFFFLKEKKTKEQRGWKKGPITMLNSQELFSKG